MKKFKVYSSAVLMAILMLAAVFSSCKSNGSIDTPTDEITGEDNFHVKVIDSCEYIFKYAGYQRGYIFAHKGNCKFCAVRHSR